MAEDAAIDQVLTSKLDTRFLDGGIIEHSDLGRHQAAEESKATKEQWIPDQETPTLSRSGRSTILLQRSEDSPIKVRVVKEIHKSIGEEDYADYSKELEAIVKFSRSSVSPPNDPRFAEDANAEFIENSTPTCSGKRTAGSRTRPLCLLPWSILNSEILVAKCHNHSQYKKLIRSFPSFLTAWTICTVMVLSTGI